MRTRNLTLENGLEVKVDYFYYPPEESNFRGDVEIKAVRPECSNYQEIICKILANR